MTKYRVMILDAKTNGWFDYCPNVYTFDSLARAEFEVETLRGLWPNTKFKAEPVESEEPRPHVIINTERFE